MSVIKGRDALGRRVWDKEHYRKIAEENGSMRVGKVAPNQKDDLKPRADIGLDNSINKKTSDPKVKGGYWCETCEVLMKDSNAYLDHLNGRTHNRLLGMSLEVKASSAKSVADRILALKGDGKRQKLETVLVTEKVVDTEPEPVDETEHVEETEPVNETENVNETEEDEEDAAILKLIGKPSFSSRK